MSISIRLEAKAIMFHLWCGRDFLRSIPINTCAVPFLRWPRRGRDRPRRSHASIAGPAGTGVRSRRRVCCYVCWPPAACPYAS